MSSPGFTLFTSFHCQQCFLLSRLVELDSLRKKTVSRERKVSARYGKNDPDRTIRQPSESKGGVREVYIKV